MTCISLQNIAKYELDKSISKINLPRKGDVYGSKLGSSLFLSKNVILCFDRENVKVFRARKNIGMLIRSENHSGCFQYLL